MLTGAGVSAESGIPTFRASDGLWESQPVEKVATLSGFRADPALVWRFYSERRAHGKACTPNPGHLSLAAVERRLGDRFLLATQNVDGLHRKAGSERLVEMHGSLWLTRCSECERPPFPDEAEYLDGTLPQCKVCSDSGRRALLRPHIVWFGEMLDPDDLQRIDDFAQKGLPRPFRIPGRRDVGGSLPSSRTRQCGGAAGGGHVARECRPAGECVAVSALYPREERRGSASALFHRGCRIRAS